MLRSDNNMCFELVYLLCTIIVQCQYVSEDCSLVWKHSVGTVVSEVIACSWRVFY